MRSATEQLAIQLTETLSKTDTIAVTGSHPLLVQSLFSALGPAFIGDQDGIILFITSDTTCADNLKNALAEPPFEMETPEIQVTTPNVIEYLMTTDRDRFDQMVKLCRRYIVWAVPKDYEDNALDYWFSIYRELPQHIPVAYFGTLLPKEDLTRLHPDIRWLESSIDANGMKPFLWYFPDAESADNEIEPEFWEICQRKNTLVSCRNEAHRLKFSELSHRAHIAIYNGANAKKNKCFQYLTRNAQYEFKLPNASWKHYCAIDPRPDDDIRLADQYLPAQAPVSIVATNHFSMLLSATKSAQEVPNRSLEKLWLSIYSLYSSLHRSVLKLDELKSKEGQQCLEYWLEQGFITRTNQTLEITKAGMSLYPGISSFTKLGSLHKYKHETVCQTINHEAIGDIESDFLHKQSNFSLAGKPWQKHFHNQLGAEAVLRVPTEFPAAGYIDAMPVVCSAKQMIAIRKLIFQATEPESVVLSAKCAYELKELREQFKTAPAEHFIEITCDSAHWWTFGGLENNAILAMILKQLAPKLNVALGNFNLRLSWPAVAESCLPKAAKRLEDIVSQIYQIKSSGMPEALKKAIFSDWKRNHTYGWLFTIVPEALQYKALDYDLQRMFSELHEALPVVVQTDHLRMIDDCLPAITDIPCKQATSSTAVTPSKRTIKTRTPPSPASKPAECSTPCLTTPIREGIMHTRYPWTYVDTEQKLAKALNVILSQNFIGLDVETTLYDQQLCLIQIGCADQSFLIDPLSVDFSGLEQVFAHPNIVKVIHNSTFECSVMKKYGIPILNIVDTMKVSRGLYGMKCPGGHSLKAVCKREFGLEMDKECQTSRWDRRPLSVEQLEYAALDAEILVHLYRHFKSK